MQAGQAIAHASAPARGGTFSRSIIVSMAAVPPPMECPESTIINGYNKGSQHHLLEQHNC
jgi:hypothetical protein